MSVSLAELDAMTVEQAQALPFEVRDSLLDLIIKDSLKNVDKQLNRQIGLMSDYYEEDLLRLLKVRGIRIQCGGFTPYDETGEVPTLVPEEQFRLVFSRMKTALERMGSKPERIVNMVIFMKNYDYWDEMNSVYREFVKSCPTRAAIGIQTLNKTYQIELVNIVVYKVAK